MADLTVIYEKGVLKPATPLNFPEGQQLQIRIIEPEVTESQLEQALQALILSGALTNPIPDPTQPLPEVPLEQQKGDLEAYGTRSMSTNLVSNIIIQERGDL